MSLMGLGNTNRKLARYTTAVGNLNKALTIRGDIGDRWGQGGVLQRLGDLHRSMKRYAEAIGHYRKGLMIRHEIGDRHDRRWYYLASGQLCMTLTNKAKL